MKKQFVLPALIASVLTVAIFIGLSLAGNPPAASGSADGRYAGYG